MTQAGDQFRIIKTVVQAFFLATFYDLLNKK